MNKADGLASFLAGKMTQSGRKGLLRDWDSLVKLFDQKVAPHLPPEATEKMLGKSAGDMNPEHNDYKAMVAYGVHAGWVAPEEMKTALEVANKSNPLWFLATSSGKTFGETISPLVAEYFISSVGDTWVKMPSTALYDVEWTPASLAPLRMELKASSEKNPRFQQIRPPTMSRGEGNDYDALLCLGVYGGKIEWWYIPAQAVEELMVEGVITQQHNAGKEATDSYWVTVDARTRERLAPYYIGDPDALRTEILRSQREHRSPRREGT
jgi:hypothetical protein